MNELCNHVGGSTIFANPDLKSGYHPIWIKEGNEWKTAFRTRYGHFEYLVMPFGLANATATFQNMMNKIFKDMINWGIVIYLDGILIFSENEADHIALVKRALSRLQEHTLAIAPKKCEWQKSRVNFLGYFISADGVGMNHEEIKTVLEWNAQETIKDI